MGDPFFDPFFPFFQLLPPAVAGRIGRLLGPLPIAGAAGAPLIGLVRFCWAP